MKYIFSVFLFFVYILSLTPSVQGAYTELDCSASNDFAANSCNQCFDGGTVAQGDNKGLLTDVWENTGTSGQVAFKEEQEMPKMIALGGSNWTEVKASESVAFWQYTEALDKLYNEEALGYVLDAGKSVVWLESSLGSAYQLTNNASESGKPVGILAYDVVTHQMDTDGTPGLDSKKHRECVLFNSGDSTPVTPVTPEPPKELPQTGPEHIFLALVALLLAAGVFVMSRKKA